MASGGRLMPRRTRKPYKEIDSLMTWLCDDFEAAAINGTYKRGATASRNSGCCAELALSAPLIAHSSPEPHVDKPLDLASGVLFLE